jgi:hypothetical protein
MACQSKTKEGNMHPAVETDFTPDQLEVAAADMARVLEQEPELSDFGYGLSGAEQTHEERRARFETNRQLIREPRSLAQFLAARQWLRQFAKIGSFNKRGTSYGLKHVAAHDMGYCTNGVFIAAAIAEGFRVRREGRSPNVVLNISTTACRRRG